MTINTNISLSFSADLLLFKLDGVGPVDNRPSTKLAKHYEKSHVHICKTCYEWDEIAKHYEKSHIHICETCYEWEKTSYRGDAEIAKHIYLVHETQDKTLN